MSAGRAQLALRVIPPTSAAEAQLEHDLYAGYENHFLASDYRLNSWRKEIDAIRMFRAYVGSAPWDWQWVQVEAYAASLRKRGLARSTIVDRVGAIKRLLARATDPAYPYQQNAIALLGRGYSQIVPRGKINCGSAPTTKRRGLTDEELAKFFAEMVEEIKATPDDRKEALTRRRNLASMYTAYAFGLRECELSKLRCADVQAAVSEEIRQFSPIESVFVREGKTHAGGGPNPRSVMAYPTFADALRVLQWYLDDVRPQFDTRRTEAVFISERGGPMKPASFSCIFAKYRKRTGLSPDLTLHCLRHTAGTNLRRTGVPLAIVKEWLGHEHESTTLLYSELPDEYVRESSYQAQRRIVRRIKGHA